MTGQMMANEKWITDLPPGMPAAGAAVRVVSARMAVVAECLPAAIDRDADDVEQVHQLRVATRRAAAALRAFSDCFPGPWLGQVKTALRDVRRAAGGVRDWDVFAASVRDAGALNGTDNEPARLYLLGLAAGFRGAAGLKLRSAVGRHGAGLAVAADAPRDHARQPESMPAATAADLAAIQLGHLLDKFNDRIASDPRSPAELHRVRIAGKRLRYAIEIFAGCVPPPVREQYYPAVEECQEVLGSANDAHVAAGRLAAIRSGVRKIAPDLAESIRPGLAALIRSVEDDARAARKEFRKWCLDWALTLADEPPADLLRAAVPARA